VTEGRRALLERLGAIESGAECARWLPLLSALADGEATHADLAELRPHLRSCSGCRATLRDFHTAPADVAALVPAVLLPLAGASGGSPSGRVEIALHALAERATLLAMRVQGAFEALPGAKLAAVAASTAALAGGGAALERAADARHAPSVTAQVVASASPGRLRLMTIASPLPPAGAAVAPVRRRSGRTAPSHGEFGSEPASRSEFTLPAASGAEFASAPPSQASVATAAPAAVATPSPPASPVAHDPPSEFSGP
jgi:hypothetical protein